MVITKSLLCVVGILLLSERAFSQSKPDAVAFTKGQTSHLQLTQGETVLFNKRITNFGAKFDAQGVFICQVAGLYAFHFHALTRTGKELWFEIYKNSQYIASEYAYTTSDYADAGQTVFLQLAEQDRVFIKAHDQYSSVIYGASDEIYTTFSGVLLKPGPLNGASNVDAFSVGLDYNAALHGDKVIYNVTFSNVTSGSGYDADTGDFTAAYNGIYIFHFHSLARTGQQLYLDLFHNDQYVESAYGFESDSYADAGNTVILYLHKGDKMSVRGSANEDVQLYGDSAEIYNVFSGALLSATQANAGGSGSSEIAFSAGLTTNLNANTSSDHHIKYDRVFINFGNSYNPTTGIFTCPKSGIYVFHFHALSQTDKNIYIDLFHNYLYVDSLYSHNPGGYAAGSNSAVIELLAGDTVYLDQSSFNSWEYGKPDEVYSTFSGYFLAPILTAQPAIG